MNSLFQDDVITISVASNPRFLTLIRCMVFNTALLLKFSEKISREIMLAVDEAITNVIKHSYNQCYEKEIIVSLHLKNDRLEIHIRDYGKKTDPSCIKSRDLNDIKPGGLGVFFIRKIMDHVEYDTSPEEGTLLKLIKYKTDCGPSPAGGHNGD
ncbi:MAG: ATP-binding protein [Candidatus Auribacterota bacterium]|jgi:anti-sigma regulatory factor (Ser/Thr protein kinase)|uniref:ATP-binding protein n=1 Tax=Candidatus Auribacter fodinae TaxID=2093366 RepID=A0A3A4QYV5_9BACT|nr:MAG: ATP-binding protein [Candidatus Auribacter fodinae]